MLTVDNVKVYDLVESILASGYAMRTVPYEKPLSDYSENSQEFKDGIQRLIRLNNASKGDIKCHNHALCGIRVSFDIKYPQYWTPEFQRYNFADIVTSSSKMHRLLKMDIDKACNKYVDGIFVRYLEDKISEYNEFSSMSNEEYISQTLIFRDGHEETYPTKSEYIYALWMDIISNTPSGLELFMRVSTNYLELQNIYFQRRHHKLQEDWGAFCKMIEELPYFKELILGEK